MNFGVCIQVTDKKRKFFIDSDTCRDLQGQSGGLVTSVNMISSEGHQTRGARTITTKIRRAIETGTYANGDQLPPERQLSETYATSRSTIRKALNNLEEAGLVVRKVGSGTFVNYTGPQEKDVDAVIDQISPLQLIDARMGFERQMTRLAIAHATGRDIDAMESVLERMEASENDKDEFTRRDSEFHLLLAKASGNPLLVHLYEQINEVRSHSQWQAAREVVLQPAQIAKYNYFHRQILNGLKSRDVNAAINALNGHMDLAHQDLVGAQDDI